MRATTERPTDCAETTHVGPGHWFLRRLPVAGVLIAGLALPLTPGAAAQNLLIENARLVDPVEETVEAGNLLIVDGRIAGRPEGVPEGFTGERIDAEGRWVLPALRDMHTHSYGNMGLGGEIEFLGTPVTARRMLYAGVAAFLDLFNAEDLILGLREQQRAGEIPGAEILASGPCITATEGHCTEYGVPTRVIDSPEDARREIGELAPKRPDVVKLVYHHTPGAMPSFDRDTLMAAVAAAREAELPTVVHIGSWQDVMDSVEAGATAITHIPRGDSLTTEMATTIAESGTYWIPTLAVHFDRPNFLSGAFAEDPMFELLLAANLRAAYAQAGDQPEPHSAEFMERQRQRAAAIPVMVAAGVPIVAGTDSGNIGTVQGYSIHRELELMVEYGVPIWEALRSATSTAGRMVGRDWGLGEGAEGSVLLLDASPVEDVRATRSISGMVLRGESVDREALLGGGS